MRVLMLEDDPRRIWAFRSHLPEVLLEWVKTPDAFRHAIEHRRYDQVWLDYDLDLTYFDDDGNQIAPEVSGMEAAEYLALHYQGPRPGLVVIHSHNPDGFPEQIETLLCGAGYRVIREQFNRLELQAFFDEITKGAVHGCNEPDRGADRAGGGPPGDPPAPATDGTVPAAGGPVLPFPEGGAGGGLAGAGGGNVA